MSLSTQRLPSSSTTPSTYDVFLSFCGQDTRNGFTDHLYAALKQRGLVVFRDDEKLQRGEVISQGLLTAIQNSQFAIVVISKNFAFSTWCLKELTQIVERMREGHLTVLPVFYHVDPSDVRKRKRSFKEAFDKHKDNLETNRRQMKSRRTDLKKVVDCVEASPPNADTPEFDEDSLKSWRAALKEVANISGWHVDNSSEATVVEEITKRILCGLHVNSLKIFENLVGIDSKVEELVSLLHLEIDDVRYIGIHGMGGVGKTTLALVLYETICCEFEAHCFISGTNRSIKELRQEIIFKILKEHNMMLWNDYDGTNLLAMSLRNKKVLIVFDDINNDQLEALARSLHWIGKKSRIVITSRDSQFWKPLVSDDNAYKVEVLNEKDALQLFCWKAFNRPKPKENFVELSVKIMRYAGGLPLAIKVIGSSLFDKGMDVWNCICDYLEANPNAEVLDKLEISYYGLNDDFSKKIFLDIACFYNGMNAHDIIPIWKSLDRHPEICIDILRHKSLLEFSHFQQFQMHDLLQKMGQRIVYRENPEEPGKRSRLFCFKDIVHLLKDKSGTNSVEGIVLKFSPRKQERLSFEGFSNFTSLKILIIKPEFQGCLLKRGIVWFGRRSKLMLSKELRLLEWHGYPFSSLPRSFQLDNLVALQMPSSNIKQLWHGWKSFEKLTCIDFAASKDLIETPDFSGTPNLQKINFSNCTSLWKVHPSIGNLNRLIDVDLFNCISLKKLPKEINWGSLKWLCLMFCLRLEKLPDLSKVPNVEEINLFGCESLWKVHHSFGNLNRLVDVDLSDCKSLRKLPKEINWGSLKQLCLRRCLRLKKLPNLSKVPNVEIIDLYGCESLWKVHSSFGNLNRLVDVDLSDCKSLKKLPKEINWGSFKQLYLRRCLRLEKLPDLSKVPNVETINLYGCESLWKVHPSFGNLNRLVDVNLFDCKSLKKLPKEINWGSLEQLCLRRCLRLEKLPDLSKVPNVKTIDLRGCESLWKVHPSFGNLKRLFFLDLSYCKSLRKLPKKISWISLSKLFLLECSRLLESEKFTKVMSNMTSLSTLYLLGTAIKMLPLSSQRLSSPRKLVVGGFKKTKLAMGGFKRTKAIQPPQDMLCGCTGFYSSNDSNLSCVLVPNWLPNFSLLTILVLEDFNLSDESFPKDFSIPSIEYLGLSGNRFTRIPEFLSQLPKLINVGLSRCKYIQSVAFTVIPDGIRLIDLKDCNLLDGAIYDDFGSSSRCVSLNLNKNEFTTLTDSFCLLSNLCSLHLCECRQLQALPKLPLSLCNLHVTESPLLEMIYCQTDMEIAWKALDTCVLVVWFSAATINGYDATPYKIIQLQPPCPINKVKRECFKVGVSWGPIMKFEIPEWFQQRSIGLFGEFQSSVDERLEWCGYALFVVYEVHEHGFPEFVCRFHFNDIAQEQPLVLRVPEAYSIGANGFWAFIPWFILSKESMNFYGQHLHMNITRSCLITPIDWKMEMRECGVLKVAITSNSSNVEVKKCGVRVVHHYDVSEFFDVLSSISPHGLELKRLKEFEFELHGGWQNYE